MGSHERGLHRTTPPRRTVRLGFRRISRVLGVVAGELGYAEHQRWVGGRSWKLGPTYLVVVRADEDHRDGSYHRCQPGLNHLAFHAASREHVDELTEKLRARGRPILYEDDHPYAGGEDHYAVFFECPERIKVEYGAPE